VSPDLLDQLAAYGEQHRAAQPPIELSDIDRAQPQPSTGTRWVVTLVGLTAAAAVIVLLLVGVVRGGEETDRIITDDPTLPPTTPSTIVSNVVPTVEWSRIDDITTSDTASVQVISDGRSFIANVEEEPGDSSYFRSDDGLRWVSTDDAPEDQFVGDSGPPPRVTLKGVTVADTGEALRTGGSLRSGPNRVIYVVNAAAGPLYEITNQEAVLINPAPSAPDERPRGRDGDDGTLTFGDAGAAYVTRFLASDVEGPVAPSELVISTDGQTWTRTTLPDEMVVSGRVRLAIGAEGVVATVQDFENRTVTVWYGSFVGP
jgi:hypothetical protein